MEAPRVMNQGKIVIEKSLNLKSLTLNGGSHGISLYE